MIYHNEVPSDDAVYKFIVTTAGAVYFAAYSEHSTSEQVKFHQHIAEKVGLTDGDVVSGGWWSKAQGFYGGSHKYGAYTPEQVRFLEK